MTIAGGNIINQAWTQAESPYIIQGDIVVPAGAYLTLQAGTELQFASTDGQASGLSTCRVAMTTRGPFTAAGTVDSPVVLKAQTGTSAGIWYGIVIDNPSA